MTLFEPIEVALRVARILERQGIEFLVGGSVASSLHGIPRSTHDVDFVARLSPANVDALVASFEGEFYIAREAVLEAVTHRSCFNLIDNTTMMKVDVFVAARDAFSEDEFEGMERKTVGDGVLPVARAEHMVVEKLRWFREGGRVSERQWRDVLGILRVQGKSLDLPRMRRLAKWVDVPQDLERALAEFRVVDG